MLGEKFIKMMAGEWFEKMDMMTVKFLSSLKQIIDRLESIEKDVKKIETRIRVEGEKNETRNSIIVEDN